MRYELAKKLKDAGFPQDGLNECTFRNCNCHNLKKCGGCSNCLWIRFPTLSELIEACGYGFRKLIHIGDEWQAESFTFGEGGVGLTPEEAVANLWLELNKTKNDLL